MGYLERSEGIDDFSQAVISLFFRLPQASIDAAKAFFDADETGVPLSGIIPLVTFGKKGQLQRITGGHSGVEGDPGAVLIGTATRHDMVPDTSSNPVTGYTEGSGSPSTVNLYFIPTTTNGSVLNTDPSCIGIDCSGDTPKLYVNLETFDQPDVSWNVYDIASSTTSDRWSYNPTTVTDSSGNHFVAHPAIPDLTVTQTMHDASTVGYRTACYTASAAPAITADEWHHLLISFDLSIACETHGTITTSDNDGPVDPVQAVKDGVDSAPKIWVALDDENQTQKNLSQFWPDGATDPNIVLTQEAYALATKQNISGGSGSTENFPGGSDPQPFNTSQTNSGIGAPSYSVGPSVIPASAASIGIAAPGEFSDVIQTVDLCDVQIYTGKTLDTGDVSKRRNFIQPAGDVLKPVDPSLAIAAMGKRPEVLFQTASDWSSGTNRGTAGNFVKTGTINGFTPTP